MNTKPAAAKSNTVPMTTESIFRALSIAEPTKPANVAKVGQPAKVEQPAKPAMLTIDDIKAMFAKQHGPRPEKSEDPELHAMYVAELRKARAYARRQGLFAPRAYRAA